jgi:hypothetical protein
MAGQHVTDTLSSLVFLWRTVLPEALLGSAELDWVGLGWGIVFCVPSFLPSYFVYIFSSSNLSFALFLILPPFLSLRCHGMKWARG